SLPTATPFSRFAEMSEAARSSCPPSGSWSSVRKPPSAEAYAMPRPMMPAPRTAMVRTLTPVPPVVRLVALAIRAAAARSSPRGWNRERGKRRLDDVARQERQHAGRRDLRCGNESREPDRAEQENDRAADQHREQHGEKAPVPSAGREPAGESG